MNVAAGGSEAIAAYWRLLKCGVVKLVYSFDGEQLNRLKQEYLYNDLRQLRKAVRDKADANENKQWSADLGERVAAGQGAAARYGGCLWRNI